MFKRIDHVEIVTDHPERTMQFYTEVLGFTVKSRDRIAAIAGAAGVEVSTHLYPEVAGHLMRVTETAHCALARVAGLGQSNSRRAVPAGKRPPPHP